jgi:hypothetical protein
MDEVETQLRDEHSRLSHVLADEDPDAINELSEAASDPPMDHDHGRNDEGADEDYWRRAI